MNVYYSNQTQSSQHVATKILGRVVTCSDHHTFHQSGLMFALLNIFPCARQLKQQESSPGPVGAHGPHSAHLPWRGKDRDKGAHSRVVPQRKAAAMLQPPHQAGLTEGRSRGFTEQLPPLQRLQGQRKSSNRAILALRGLKACSSQLDLVNRSFGEDKGQLTSCPLNPPA